jgi:hypothetical protein
MLTRIEVDNVGMGRGGLWVSAFLRRNGGVEFYVDMYEILLLPIKNFNCLVPEIQDTMETFTRGLS